MPHFAYLAKPEPNLLIIIIIVSFFIWLLVYYYFYFSFRIFGGLKVDWCRVLMDPCKFLVALSMHCSFTLCELKWALISMCNFLGFSILPVFHVVYGWFFQIFNCVILKARMWYFFEFLGWVSKTALLYMYLQSSSWPHVMGNLNEDMTIVVVIAFMI